MSKSTNNLEYVLAEVHAHLENCKQDKYAADNADIDTGMDLLGPNHKAINTWNIKKYLKRYCTEGFKKSGLKSDLLKIIHYALFELEAIREEPKDPVFDRSICKTCIHNPKTCGIKLHLINHETKRLNCPSYTRSDDAIN